MISLTVVVVLATIFSIRFLSETGSGGVHYHASFAVYIEGEKKLFEHPGHYVETSACGADFSENPLSRAHLHKPNPHVIHIHDKAVSWQHFFSNLGWGINNRWLTVGEDFYKNEEDRKLRFILNGRQVDYPTSKVINNGDALLVDYGSDPIEILHQRFIEIDREAAYKANLTNDPASCGGETDQGLFNRIIKAIDLRN